MAVQLQGLLEVLGVTQHVLAFVKDGGGNPSTMVTTLRSIVLCNPLQRTIVFEDVWFGYIISKACQLPLMMQMLTWA